MNAVLKILGLVLGTALVLFLWYHASPLVVAVLDFNLWAIKRGCALIPAPYGAMVESALRVGLAADKALLLAEGTWVVGGFLRLFKWGFSSPTSLPKRNYTLVGGTPRRP